MTTTGGASLARRFMPWLFVLIWSTGFIVARYGMPHAPPLKFLSLRYLFSLLVLVPLVSFRREWPRDRGQWLHLIVVGALMQAGYLGGVWSAVKHGIAAGTVALIVGLQPLLTAVLLSARGHRVSGRQWLGLLLGFGGLALVVVHKLDGGGLSTNNLILAMTALASITAGTLWQKRFVAPGPVWGALAVQMCSALALSAPLAMLEREPVVWAPAMIGALAWSVLALTIGAGALLYLLIQRGAAVQVTSLIYWVPPVTAVMGWVLFRESLGITTLTGMALVAAGVVAVTRNPPTPMPR